VPPLHLGPVCWQPRQQADPALTMHHADDTLHIQSATPCLAPCWERAGCRQCLDSTMLVNMLLCIARLPHLVV
jgi:hypothetical protein